MPKDNKPVSANERLISAYGQNITPVEGGLSDVSGVRTYVTKMRSATKDSFAANRRRNQNSMVKARSRYLG